MSKNSDITKLTLEEKVNLMIDILQGNPLDDTDDGLLGDFKYLKKEFYKLKAWRDKTVAWALGVSFGGGALITFLITILIKSLTHTK